MSTRIDQHNEGDNPTPNSSGRWTSTDIDIHGMKAHSSPASKGSDKSSSNRSEIPTRKGIDSRKIGRSGRLKTAAAMFIIVAFSYVIFNFVVILRAAGQESSENAQAIVVLGSAQYDGRPAPVLRARLDRALELWRESRAPIIAVTGAGMPGDRTTEAEASAKYLADNGVPTEIIFVSAIGHDTFSSLKALSKSWEGRGIDKVLYVTDGYHARRVRDIGAEVGLNGGVAMVHDPPISKDSLLTHYLHETASVSAGRIFGYSNIP